LVLFVYGFIYCVIVMCFGVEYGWSVHSFIDFVLEFGGFMFDVCLWVTLVVFLRFFCF